jgi:hypothetical protein
MLLPVVCGADVTVPVDDVDEEEATEDEELVLWIDFRGANMPRTSSGFIALSVCPPLIPHAGRFKLAKLWGFATAVMGKSGFVGRGKKMSAWSVATGPLVTFSRVSQGNR